MTRIGLMAAGILAAMGLSLSNAHAVPALKSAAAEPAANTMVEKVHGFHRYCAWGPARYHRHIPGVGNVACARGPVYRSAPIVVVPRYRRPRVVVVPRYRGPVVRYHHRRGRW